MHKKLHIIFGVLVGTVVSTVMIVGGQSHSAFGAINWWDEVVAYDDAFDWKDVFSPSSNGQDMYALVHAKLLRYPSRDAVSEIAKNSGLTRDEAQAVINGSLSPLYNTGAAKITQNNAATIMAGIQEQYSFLKEVFELQHELDLYTAPSEIFANNDLVDSGFDLIHDLSVIEEILFIDIVDNTIGKPFGDQLDSPYKATDGYKTLPPYVEQKTPSAVGLITSGLEVDSESGDSEGGVEDGSIAPGTADILIGDTVVGVEVLGDDICPVPADDLVAALEKYKGSNFIDSSNKDDSGDELSPDTNNLAELLDDVDPLTKKGTVIDNSSGLSDTDLVPAPADEWRTAWCPGLSIDSGNTASGSTFGTTGFGSLGGFVNSLIGQSAGAMAAAGNENFAAHIAVCLETEFVTRTVSSYQPGEPCVLCELEEINEIMSKTLSHSLVPNKATGNLLESAKCKDSYGSFLDMQFIALSAPIPTPSNDEAIYGKNIFEEWNSFVERYQPILLPPIDVNYSQKFESSPSCLSQAELLKSINSDLDSAREKALLDVANLERSYDATNTTTYLQIVVAELDSMTNFFENYNKLYNQTYDVCKDIGKKKTLD